MLKTKKELQREELEKFIQKITPPRERRGLYSPEKPKDEIERFGFPKELWSIME